LLIVLTLNLIVLLIIVIEEAKKFRVTVEVTDKVEDSTKDVDVIATYT